MPECVRKLTEGTETQITTNSADQKQPAIYDDRIMRTAAVELTPLNRTSDLRYYVENTLSSGVGVKKLLLDLLMRRFIALKPAMKKKLFSHSNSSLNSLRILTKKTGFQMLKRII